MSSCAVDLAVNTDSSSVRDHSWHS